MAVLTFGNINVNDLDERLIDSIRAFFKGQEVQISITVKETVAEKLESGSLSELLDRNTASEIVYRIPSEEINKIAEQLEADENFDPVSAIKKFATPRHQTEPV